MSNPQGLLCRFGERVNADGMNAMAERKNRIDPLITSIWRKPPAQISNIRASVRISAVANRRAADQLRQLLTQVAEMAVIYEQRPPTASAWLQTSLECNAFNGSA